MTGRDRSWSWPRRAASVRPLNGCGKFANRFSGAVAVFALGLRQPALDALDPMRVARVIAEELRWLVPLGCAPHALPEGHRLMRVVPGPRHIDQADVIRLGFLR